MSENQYAISKPRPFRTIRTVAALMLREMSTTYGRSVFGYLWAILEPVGGILLLTAVFSLALRTPPLGTSFPLFYASGLLPFGGYLAISGKLAQALRFSRPLLAFPAITYVDPILARFLLNGLTQLVVAALVFSSIILGARLDVILDYSSLITALAMVLALSFGVGVMNCFLFMRFPSWERVWSIVNRPLFFISGIFFMFEQIPEPYTSFLWFNPLIHVIGMTRKGIYATYNADYVSVFYVVGVSGALAVLGLLLLRRHYRDLLNS